jgi:hypothetical protein
MEYVYEFCVFVYSEQKAISFQKGIYRLVFLMEW